MAYISKWHGEQIDEGVGKALDLDIGEFITRTEYEGDAATTNAEISDIKEDISGLQQTINDEVGRIDGEIQSTKDDVTELREDVDGMYDRFQVYIGPAGNDNNDGLDTSRKMRTLQAVLDKYKDKKELFVRLDAGTYNIGNIAIYNKNLFLSGVRNSSILNGKINGENGVLRLEYIDMIGPETADSSTYTVSNRYGPLFMYACNITAQGSGTPVTLVRCNMGAFDLCNFTAPSESSPAITVSGGSIGEFSSCNLSGILRVANGGMAIVDRGTRSGITKVNGGIVFVDGVMQ